MRAAAAPPTCAAGSGWARYCAGPASPTVELRASIVIGAGSLSFEMIRSLVQRLPVMVMPRWVSVPAQPIAITDVLDYLVAAGEMDR